MPAELWCCWPAARKAGGKKIREAKLNTSQLGRWSPTPFAHRSNSQVDVLAMITKFILHRPRPIAKFRRSMQCRTLARKESADSVVLETTFRVARPNPPASAPHYAPPRALIPYLPGKMLRVQVRYPPLYFSCLFLGYSESFKRGCTFKCTISEPSRTHQAKPFFQKQTKSWYCSFGGKQVALGKDRESAFTKFHELMAERATVRSEFSTLYDLSQAYLDWCEINRGKATYAKHRLYLRSFIASVGKRLKIAQLKQLHLTKWIDLGLTTHLTMRFRSSSAT